MCAFRSGSESQCRPGGGGPIWPTFGDAPGDERKSRINDGVASAPVRSTSARSAGSCGGFCGDWKWGQNPGRDIISEVTIPESLLPQGKNRGQPPERSQYEQKREIPPLPLSGKKAILERRYQEDGSRSITAFIERAVEQDIVAGILVDEYQFSSEDLRRRRAESVQNVRKTNGRISLEQRVRGAWGEDDEWQD